MRDYEEYFIECSRMGKTEQEIIQDLDEPHEIAMRCNNIKVKEEKKINNYNIKIATTKAVIFIVMSALGLGLSIITLKFLGIFEFLANGEPVLFSLINIKYILFISIIMKKKLDSFEIVGVNKLFGEIKNQTSKNATLPIMSASLLCDGAVRILDVPNITDVDNMIKILRNIGAKVRKVGNDLTISPQNINNIQIDCELSKTMRSSLFLLGPMLSRFGEVDLTLPGGCKIGKRPIDIHINAFKKLGVDVEVFDDHVFFKVEKVRANKIKLKIPSVGATENIVQFACKLKGKTTIINPAKEPEVVDLCNFLNQMGAKILGAGTNKITIYGVDKLTHTEYKPIGDRIVSGTVMVAVALCGGDVTITNSLPYQNLKLIEILTQLGCQIDFKNDIIHIVKDKDLHAKGKISTGYHPKFPTDMQSMLLALSCLVNGETLIEENIFENRFLIIPELKKLGANVQLVDSKTAKVVGVKELIGTTVCALDLRGGASLVLLGLVSKGKTIVKNVHFIDRGYDKLEEMLNNLGANIRRI